MYTTYKRYTTYIGTTKCHKLHKAAHAKTTECENYAQAHHPLALKVHKSHKVHNVYDIQKVHNVHWFNQMSQGTQGSPRQDKQMWKLCASTSSTGTQCTQGTQGAQGIKHTKGKVYKIHVPCVPCVSFVHWYTNCVTRHTRQPTPRHPNVKTMHQLTRPICESNLGV